jgi:hypothetical protein
MNDPEDAYKKIIQMSFGYFGDTKCTPESLKDFTDMVRSLIATSGRSMERIYSDLERQHNVTVIGTSSILEDKGDHIDWFNPSLNTGLHR